MSRSAVLKAIQELASLHRDGILTDDEFQHEKTLLLARLREAPLPTVEEEEDDFEEDATIRMRSVSSNELRSERHPTEIHLDNEGFVPKYSPPLYQQSSGVPQHTVVEVPSFGEFQFPYEEHQNEEPDEDEFGDDATIQSNLTIEELHTLLKPPTRSSPYETSPLIPKSMVPSTPAPQSTTPAPQSRTPSPQTAPLGLHNHEDPNSQTHDDLPQAGWVRQRTPPPSPQTPPPRAPRPKRQSLYNHTMDFEAVPSESKEQDKEK